MMRGPVRHLVAAASLTAALAACTGPFAMPATTVEAVSAVGPAGTFTVTGDGFFQFPGGPGMRVEACGVTVDAAIVDPATVEVLLPPAGLVTVQAGDTLTVTLPGVVAAGRSDLRVVRPDGQVVVVEDAVDCPAPGPEDRPVVAAISADVTEGVAPLTVSFSAAASTGDAPLTYAWDLGDGTSATGATVTHRFTEPGVYTVVLVVTDVDGDVDAASVVVTAVANQPPSARIGYVVQHSSTPDASALVTLSAGHSTDPNGDDLTYEWYVGGALHGTAESYETPWAYDEPLRLRLVVTDEHGAADEDELIVLLDPPESEPGWGGVPVLDVTETTVRVNGDQVALSLKTLQPFGLVEPGAQYCAGLDVPPAELPLFVGFIGFDVDEDPWTGALTLPDYGMEYALLLAERDADGNFPIVATADMDVTDCVFEPDAVVQWVPATTTGDTVTFTFDVLAGSDGDFKMFGYVFGGSGFAPDALFH